MMMADFISTPRTVAFLIKSTSLFDLTCPSPIDMDTNSLCQPGLAHPMSASTTIQSLVNVVELIYFKKNFPQASMGEISNHVTGWGGGMWWSRWPNATCASCARLTRPIKQISIYIFKGTWSAQLLLFIFID